MGDERREEVKEREKNGGRKEGRSLLRGLSNKAAQRG